MTSPSRPRSRRAATAAGTLALGLAMSLVPAVSPDTAPVSAPRTAARITGPSSVGDPSGFYTPPADLPAELGAVIRTEPMLLTPSTPDFVNGGALPADARRIMYRSTGAAGGPVAVTGTYLQPKAPWNGPGPRPLAVVTPGTQGQGDQCAPSRSMAVGLGIQTTPPSVALGYAVTDTTPLLQEGFAVVVTDYEGLGTPGHHPYVNRESQGRAALDAARAALRLPGTDLTPDSRTVIGGFSQGGGAAAAAAEMHGEYAPDVNLVAIAAGAPPSDMLGTLERMDGGLLTGAVGYTINGMLELHPELRPAVDRLLNDEGRRMLDVVADQCAADTAATYGLRRTSDFTADGRPLGEVLRSEPELLRVLESYNLGATAPAVPALVLAGRNDDVVPHHSVVDLVRRWCSQGAVVEMQTSELPAIAPGLLIDHAAPMQSARGTSARYLMDRVRDVPAPNSCGTV